MVGKLIDGEEIKSVMDIQIAARKSVEEAGKKLVALQERIRRGESSGDGVKDFAISFYGIVDEETQKPYKELERRIKENQGNLVLAVSEEKVPYSLKEYCAKPEVGGQEGLIPPKQMMKTLLELQMGYIGGELGFDLRSGEHAIVLPTKKHVLGKSEMLDLCFDPKAGLQNLEWVLKKGVEGQIKVPAFELTDFMPESVKAREGSYGGILAPYNVSTSNILIGDEVDKYFTLPDGISDAYCRAVDLLSS